MNSVLIILILRLLSTSCGSVLQDNTVTLATPTRRNLPTTAPDTGRHTTYPASRLLSAQTLVAVSTTPISGECFSSRSRLTSLGELPDLVIQYTDPNVTNIFLR